MHPAHSGAKMLRHKPLVHNASSYKGRQGSGDWGVGVRWDVSDLLWKHAHTSTTILALLDAGFNVRGAVRDDKKAGFLKSLDGRIETVVVGDMLKVGWRNRASS